MLDQSLLKGHPRSKQCWWTVILVPQVDVMCAAAGLAHLGHVLNSSISSASNTITLSCWVRDSGISLKYYSMENIRILKELTVSQNADIFKSNLHQ